jgi:lipopolysaccharide export LptBFGC system permease protein LptF
MSEHQIVSLILLTGFLILIAAGFGTRNVSWRKGLFMAGAWAGIFAIVILVIDIVS